MYIIAIKLLKFAYVVPLPSVISVVISVVLSSIDWYLVVFSGIQWYSVVLSGIQWY